MSTSQTPYEAVGESVLNEALTRARGRHQPYCIAEEPKRQYYVSNLAPTHGVTDDEEFVSQIKPSAITLEFKPSPLTRTLDDVEIEFDVYYPSVPTYAEYRDIREQSIQATDIQQANRPSTEPDDAAADGGTTVEADGSDVDDRDDDYGLGDVYALDEDFYRRVTITTTVDLDLSNPNRAAASATDTIQTAIDDALRTALDEVPATRAQPDPDDFPNYDFTDLSEDEFESVVDTLPTLSPDDPSFNWNVTFDVDVRDHEVGLRLCNEPVETGDEEEEGPDETHIFNPRIAVVSPLEKYEFDLLPEDYRFDQFIWAKGRNCSTTVEPVDEAANKYRVATTATPTSPVYEFEFNTDYDTRFSALAGNESEDPMVLLETIASGMDDYFNGWIHDRLDDFLAEFDAEDAWRDYKDGSRLETVFELADEDLDDEESDWEGPAEVIQFVKAAVNFHEEIERFRHGISVLTNEADVRHAFQLMNEVNHRVHWKMAPDNKGFDSWRLFQLVFIVSNISSIVTRDPADRFRQYETQYDEMAEVLWFPTGGGKTEGYLGLVLFNLFFDRMRGKSNGVTAWIRFPLRLLSRQQKQRFLKAMLVADDIRTTPEDEGGLGGAGRPFSLGYFPGSHDSPNDIGKNNNLDEDYRAASSNDRAREKFEDDCQHIEECPLCDSDVTIRYDETANSVYHYCTGDDCIDRIPLYVVDHDIYRYTPSVLLGSLDKIAVMGMNPLFANLFGNFTTRCPDHGLGYSSRCPEKHLCQYEDGSDNFEDVQPGTRQDRDAEYFDPIPTLHLVDEVHLLNEELGAFASHYETLYLTLCQRISEVRNEDGEVVEEGVTPKVLTSTATIEKYERQIENLFQMEATRFPEEGPNLGETFYGELNKQRVEREYTGLTPNNRTHLYAVLDLVKQYHEVIRDYYKMTPDELASEIGYPAAEFDADTQASVLDAYETSLVYFTNKREGNTYRKNIRKQINDEMEEDGYEVPLEAKQLTADTRDDDTLPRLEREGEFADASFEERIDTVPATSFVGHGIDVDRFNFMLFFGYPSQTFQYIQASSRVGRQSGVPGNVLDVFRPFDKRDRHRYKYFEKLHEFLDRTVEPVPIDRWAKFAIEETFSGVTMSVLIQYFRPKLYRKTDDDGDPVMVDVKDEPERINLQSAAHLYEVMNNNSRFPELTKETMREFVYDAYVLRDRPIYLGYMPDDGDGLYTNQYFVEEADERMDAVWQHWRASLQEEMNTPEFEEGDEPMRSLRDIGEDGDIFAFTNSIDFIEALERH